MSAQEGNPYRIDTNRIFLAGVSAGAVSAIHAAYPLKEMACLITSHLNLNSLEAFQD